MITRNQISKAIKEKHNLDVDVFHGCDDCCHFFAKEDKDGNTIDEVLATRLAMAYSTTVYVCKLNHLSIEQWVEAFEEIIK